MDELGKSILKQFGIPTEHVTGVSLSLPAGRDPQLVVSRLVRDEEYQMLNTEIEHYKVTRSDA